MYLKVVSIIGFTQCVAIGNNIKIFDEHFAAVFDVEKGLELEIECHCLLF